MKLLLLLLYRQNYYMYGNKIFPGSWNAKSEYMLDFC